MGMPGMPMMPGMAGLAGIMPFLERNGHGHSKPFQNGHAACTVHKKRAKASFPKDLYRNQIIEFA